MSGSVLRCADEVLTFGRGAGLLQVMNGGAGPAADPVPVGCRQAGAAGIPRCGWRVSCSAWWACRSMSQRSVVTRPVSWRWVTNGDGLPGRRVARRAARVAPGAPRGRLVTLISFADAVCVWLLPVPHRGFAGGPFQDQGAGRVFDPG